jgi:hypothetical protein
MRSIHSPALNVGRIGALKNEPSDKLLRPAALLLLARLESDLHAFFHSVYNLPSADGHIPKGRANGKKRV